MRVIVVDDSMIVREGLAALLEQAGVTVTFRLGDAGVLDAIIGREPPDVIVIDIRMPPTFTDEGLRAAASIRTHHPEIGVLVLSQHVELRYAQQVVEEFPAGGGYLLKDRITEIRVLVEALQRIVRGDLVIDPTLVSRLIGRRRHDDPLQRLSQREREVLGLVAEGLNNDAISRRLGIAERTVESHIARLFQKLDIAEHSDGHRRVMAVLTYLRYQH